MNFPILSLLSLILACSTARDSAQDVAIPPPIAAPGDLGAETPSGPSVTGIDIDGLEALITGTSEKVRVYNFWATWCGPCVAELPMLRDFAVEHTEVELILVSLDMHSVRAKRVLPFIAKYELTKLKNYHLEDKDPAIAMRRFEGWPDAIPVTYIVDREGQIQKKINAALSREQLTAALTTLSP
mgnify:CR=1 FL=1